MKKVNSFCAAVLLLLLAGVFAAQASTVSQQIAVKRANGRIVYQSERNNQSEIFVMDADGQNPVRLTDNNVDDFQPSFSPDGAKIAFVSRRDESAGEIYVMNVDGSNPVRLTNNLAEDSCPTWSLSGAQLAFQSDRDGQPEIFVINTDGSGEKKLAAGHATRPKWSPDGSRIAFASIRDGGSDIFVMTADGKSPVNLTSNSSGNDVQPAWSPDATKLAFTTNRDGNWEIYAMSADGSNPSRLTIESATDEEPAWKTVGSYSNEFRRSKLRGIKRG